MLKNRLILALKILIPLAVFGAVGWKLYESWDKIREIHWSPNYLLLTLSGICYAVAYIPAALYWHYVLKALGQMPGRYETFRAYYIGHLGKYVPGKVMVLVIRSGLLNLERTKLSTAAASIFLETMTMMAVGAFVAAMIVFLLLWKGTLELPHWLTFLTLGIMCCTVLPIVPPVFHFVAKKCRTELHGLRFRTLAAGWILNIPVWLMLGGNLWMILLGFGMESQSIFTELLYCTLAVSMAVVLGFATLIPAGFGARELVAVLILVPFFQTHPLPIGVADPTVMAGVTVAVQRIISILSELTVSALLAWKRR